MNRDQLEKVKAAAVAKIHGGIVDCVGCDLSGADLTNTCVKEHDLHGKVQEGAGQGEEEESDGECTGDRQKHALVAQEPPPGRRPVAPGAWRSRW